MDIFDFMRACIIEYNKEIKERIIENQEENKAFQNKIGLKNYQENTQLIKNAEKETSLKNTLEHKYYIEKVRQTIILDNLQDAIL